MPVRLGDLLVKHGVLTERQRDDILAEQRMVGRPFGELAERLFGVCSAAVERAWAQQYAAISGLTDLGRAEFDPFALSLISRRQAWQFKLLPVRFENDELMIATTQECLPRALKFAGWKLGQVFSFVIVDPSQMAELMLRHYPMDGASAEMIAGKSVRSA